ncbi:AfsR/SARP family transcriptional regulator [Rhodococcus sp. PAMC28707]|nr:AfsR/SARP family transcriptional regulator [Rhodococcus sp. PAMC28705]QCB61060.1 AfsR/SARP family transcriptional regulator [Rhodococcus sp. PAMC28707]
MRVGGDFVHIPGMRARALLAALATSPGRSRSTSALIDDIWPDAPPRSPKNALQTQVSRLRTALPPGTVEIGPAGYRLLIEPEQLDLTSAEIGVAAAEGELARGNFDSALDVASRALELWRGEPGEDLPAGSLADDLRGRATAASFSLDAVRIEALLGLGNIEQALPYAKAAVLRDRLDERFVTYLMLCLDGLGRTNEALEVFARLKQSLAERLGTDPSPELVNLNAELLRPKAQELPRSIGLRIPPNELIGREQDIAAIEASMKNSRVTTILGPGGSGKTRIAHELGMRASVSQPVAFVELASLHRSEDVAAAIIATLGLSESELSIRKLGMVRVHTSLERLREALSARPSVLILDNCEHVIDDVASVVDELVSASRYLTVLTTSRTPLRISAESMFPLPSLRVLGLQAPATVLFGVRARAVRSSAVLEASEVEKLCRTLDGLPLAIELAAARVRTMSVTEIISRLEHRFTLLRTSDRTRPERHRTLHAVIDWSWNLLDIEMRSALCRLCRFPAGFTFDAARSVAEWGEVTDIDAALTGLVDQSLLTVTERHGIVRYHMLETVREYAEQQSDSEEKAALTQRMSKWGLLLAEAAADKYRAGRQVELVVELEDEHDNLLAVLREAAERREWGHFYSILAVFVLLWALRGSHSEVLKWAPDLLDAERDGPALDWVSADAMVLAHVVILGHLAHSSDQRDVARVRLRLRRVLHRRTEIEPGLRLIAELLTGRFDGRGLARQLAESTRASHASERNAAFLLRAGLYENSGYLYPAAKDALAAREIALARNDAISAASASQFLGSIYGQSGQSNSAIEFYEEAADMLWNLHSFEESIQTRGFLGGALISAGRIDEGRALLDDLDGVQIDVESRGGREPGSRDPYLSALIASRAEADLAQGHVDSGLALFRRVVGLSGFSSEGMGDSYLTMQASASVSAHVLFGRHGEVADSVDVLRAMVTARMGPGGIRDLPQIGAVACAVGSYDVQSGRDPGPGLTLIALSVKAFARQDFPSMRPQRHLDAAAAVLGAATVEAEAARVAHTTRAGALRAILDLLC